jgi:Kdo2-lipid IVA lauroyltransferase/acyltransferase
MLEYILYKAAYFLVKIIPLKFAYLIGGSLSFFYYHLLRKGEREILKENLRVVFPEWSEKQIRKCARKNFSLFGRFLAQFFYLGRLNKKNIGKLCKIENLHYIEETAALGKGTIAMGAHFGNWELGCVALSLAGLPISAVALDHKNKKVNDIFINQRKQKGVNVISAERGAKHIFKALKRGDIFTILGDRDTTSGGVEVEFFGRRAVFPRGAPALCCKTGAPIAIGMMVKQKNGGYNLVFHKPIIADPSRGIEESEKKIMDQWIKLLESYIRAYPEQWFMYHRVFLK